MEACKDLADYAEYTYRVRKYAKEMSIEDAVEKTINECIREDILKDFLLTNRAEAKKVSIYEYNEEAHMRMEREEGLAAGREQIVELISKMSADGLGNQISRLGSDSAFYQEMMKKYFG